MGRIGTRRARQLLHGIGAFVVASIGIVPPAHAVGLDNSEKPNGHSTETSRSTRVTLYDGMTLEELKERRASTHVALPVLLAAGGVGLVVTGEVLRIQSEQHFQDCVAGPVSLTQRCDRDFLWVPAWLVGGMLITTGVWWAIRDGLERGRIDHELERRANAARYSLGVAPTRGGSLFMLQGQF